MLHKDITLTSLILSLTLLGCGGGSGSSSTAQSTNISNTPIGTVTTEENTPNTLIEQTSTPQDTTSPLFLSTEIVIVKENHVAVLQVKTEDQSTVTYSISEGEDYSQFYIDKQSGTLRFMSAPNFELPSDKNYDNNYTVEITATDNSNNSSNQMLYITVEDIEENSTVDSDGDHIPDNIEILLEMDANNNDINNNNILDGLDIDGSHGDPFFKKQWYIQSLGTVTNESGIESIVDNDLHLIDLYHTYMGYNKGENIIVQVVDTGVDADHEDLFKNMDLSRSYDGTQVGDPSGKQSHGTMIAGIIASRAFNGKGIRGIAPFAKVAASNWLSNQTLEGLTKAWLTGEGANEISISNNSWGMYFDIDTDYEDIMALGTQTLRDGKGRIYVFAAGNDRLAQGNTNLQYYLNNRFVITVAGLKHDNTYADYSTPGTNILVSGYSGNYYQDSPTIGTTTIMGSSSNTGTIDTKTTWDEDTSENYTFTMNGTSAASPTVAASIALVLEACPNLTWRDVKYLIAKHAKQVDSGNTSWIKNKADLWHSIDYGFGLINTEGMIDACTHAYTNLSDEKSETVTKEFNIRILDNNTIYSFELNTIQSIKLEWVEVTLDNDSSHASDYKIELISPNDTKTTLITEDTDNSRIGTHFWMSGGFRLSSAAFIDESSQGSWKVEITDTTAGYTGTLKNITLKVYGH